MILEESLIQQTVQEHLSAIYFGLVWAAFAVYFAWKGGWFSIYSPPPISNSSIKFLDVIAGFAYFIISQAIVIPAVFVFVYFLETGQQVNLDQLSQVTKSWLSVGIILGAYLSLLLFYFLYLTPEQRKDIFGTGEYSWYKQYLIGTGAWFLIFPIIIIWSQFSEMLILVLTKEAPSTQLAVEQFKLVIGHPVLMTLLGFIIFALTPIAEEFLFRGLLQSWLIKYFDSTIVGIVLASVVFALFHFAPSQGTSNIPLISTLFLLSCTLGFLYKKQQSLWASIGLHSTFNAISLLMIMKGDG